MMRFFIPITLLTASILWSTPTTAAEQEREPLIAKPDAFKTLVNPNCSHCKDEAIRRKGELRDHDPVLCWIRGKYDGGAIPHRFFLNPYRVISDTYGVFVYDADAGFSRGFEASLDFNFHGWRNGVMVMKHKDGTLYSCLTGTAFDGPRKGGRLAPVPTLVSEWGYWSDRYPGGVAYHMYDKYQPLEMPTTPNEDAKKSRGPEDKRLNSEQFVLGVNTGKATRAYPLDGLEKSKIFADNLGKQECVILWYAPTKTASAFTNVASPTKKDSGSPRKVTLSYDEKNSAAPFTDKETGSRWDIAGRAVDGELKGWTLEWLDSTVVKWFAWSAEYPETSVYGK